MAMEQIETDVTVVGGGPTGLALATLLGQRGMRVVVLERWPQPYPLPRAVHFDHEVGRIFQAVGIAGDLDGFTEPAPIYEWRNATGQILLRFGRERDSGLSGWPESNMFHQPHLEAALERRAVSTAGVTLRRGCELKSFRQDADGVTALAQIEGGGELEVRSKWLVGCDGANSLVRAGIGASWDDLGFAFDWLVVDIVEKQPKVWDPLNWQLCDPERPTTLVSGGPGRRRWEFMRLPHETIEELNDSATAWRLLEAWGVRPDNATLERHAVYTFRACWSDRWRAGRVLLAGDAAHLMPPFAGQGLCSGQRDAISLAWRLGLVHRGLAPESLLDSYGPERAPHVKAIIDFSVELGRVICISDPEQAAQRDAQMVPLAQAMGLQTPMPWPKIGAGCWDSDSPAAGGLFVQGAIETDGRRGRFDDIFGASFALVGYECDPRTALSPAQQESFRAIGGIVVQVSGPGGVADRDGAYRKWFEENGARVALQRPDFVVFGTAADVTGAGRLIDELGKRLAGR